MLCATALGGCSAPAPAELPSGITVAIFQNRTDYGARDLEIAVTNDGREAITITTAAFVSERFSGGTAWSRPAQIAPGQTQNLRVALGQPVCEGGLGASVRLEFVVADGSSGVATLTPTDRFDTVAKVTAQDCLASALAAIAEIRMGETVRTEMHGDRLVGMIDLIATSVSASHTAAVLAVDRTILLRPEDDGATGWPLGWTLGPTRGTMTATLSFEPSNCNPHIVAEDKRGTFFPLDVALDDGTRGLVSYGVTDEVRGAIYEYIADYCGWS
jgi:hypothetical protein